MIHMDYKGKHNTLKKYIKLKLTYTKVNIKVEKINP